MPGNNALFRGRLVTRFLKAFLFLVCLSASGQCYWSPSMIRILIA
jgi:hypothetical protein